MPQTKITKLFRVENPNIPARPDGINSHEDLVGQWFTPNLATATKYLQKATRQPGAQLVVAEVPTEALDGLHVSRHPIASDMDVEPDNYLVPRDGTVPFSSIELDSTLGDLCGRLSNVRNLLEAQRRVGVLVQSLGAAALTQAK